MMSLIKHLKSPTTDHMLITKPVFGVLYFEALVMVFESYEVIAAVCSFIGLLGFEAKLVMYS